MSISFIIALCLAVITVIIVINRPRSSKKKNALLRSHLKEGRDYRFFVGVPLKSPTKWMKVMVNGQTLSLDGEDLNLNKINSFLVAYPNGEVLSVQREFYPLPDGIHFVNYRKKPRKDILDLTTLEEGKKFVEITYGTSGSRPNQPGYYSTTIRNISAYRLRVIHFGAFTKSGLVFRLNTITGDYFTADQFINWYGTPEDGWIAPNTSVSDPNNYGSGDGYWVYYFETENGVTFAAGAPNQ
ncbi:hypothetical protein KKF34_17330 [Myxococcota bacterium]|nr:hypothetical protein [Myxococcota bacterium]MBU1380299.1 hypothetical protein [Myxococcota bacterium]MBU1498644.1 hypothetical protein [Myxococcota bacterium]